MVTAGLIHEVPRVGTQWGLRTLARVKIRAGVLAHKSCMSSTVGLV